MDSRPQKPQEGILKEETRPIIEDSAVLSGIYKKNGSFDRQRKILLENFKESETHSNLLLKLKLMVENKVKNDPQILMKNKGKMAALIQGEIMSENNGKDGHGLLSIVDKDIQEKIIESPEFHNILKGELKDTKRKAEGITDEEYVKQLEEENVQKQEMKKNAEVSALNNEDNHENNFTPKSHRPNTSNRVTKAPRFNIRSDKGGEKSSSKAKDFHLMY